MNDYKPSAEIQELINSGMSIKDLPNHIIKMIKANENLLLHGGTGIGKTTIINQVVEEMRKENPNYTYYYMTLSAKEPADLIGVPTIEKDENGNNRTTWATPKDLPNDPNEKGLIFIDEINNSQPQLQNAIQQLIQERKLGDYTLPSGISIISAMNPDENGYSNELQAPVKNRFAHKYVLTDTDSWLDWLLGDNEIKQDTQPNDLFTEETTEQEIKELIGGFVKIHPELLYDEISLRNNSYLFATPRTWLRIVKLWYMYRTASEKEIKHLASQYIGINNTTLLLDYCKDKQKYQSPSEILLDGKPFRDNGTDINCFYSTYIGIKSMLLQTNDNKLLGQMINNLITAMKKLERVDLQTAVATEICRKEKYRNHLSLDEIIKLSQFIGEGLK